MKMLLKYSAAQKKIRGNNNGKLSRLSGGVRVGTATALPRHRKILNRTRVVVKRELTRPPLDPCDNSNDSGLGFEHHPVDSHPASSLAPFSFSQASQKTCWLEEPPDLKRRRPDVKLESDNANAEFSFPHQPPAAAAAACASTAAAAAPPVCGPTAAAAGPRPGRRHYGKRLSNIAHAPASAASARHAGVFLQILCQPEQQHRARYQTEGSRGAVKDRTGNGFPVVKLVGFAGPATLEVFIGTDQGRIAPHMFYQACRVAGKNATPCLERKTDGTVLIHIEFDPAKDMAVTCDCVGILKERNVDVEQRFPEESCARSKKKSTRCRMVFRTTLTDQLTGQTETLQVASQPIVCTQPPGVPEICKRSLSACAVSGGAELFILGKNFLKDTRVVFQRMLGDICVWEQAVLPDKEFLQQSHLVCKVPPYEQLDIKEPVSVLLKVVSSSRHSEPQSFLYTPDTAQLWPSLGPPIKSELPPSRLMPPPPPLIPVGAHLYAAAAKAPPPLSSTQKLDAIVNSAADAHIRPLLLSAAGGPTLLQDMIGTSAAEAPGLMRATTSLLTEQTAASDQLLAEIITKSERELAFPQAASTQRRQLLAEIMHKTEMQLQLHEAMRESDAQLMRDMSEPSSQELIHRLNETSPLQLMQSMNEASSQQILQSMSESSSQQLMQHINESNTQQLMQSMNESNTQQLMQSMNEASSQQLMQNLNDASSQQLMQSVSESSPQQLMQSLAESSPQQLMQSLSESSPQQLMQNMTESSPEQLMQSLSESSPEQLMQSLSESSPQQLMQSMDTSSQQLMQSLSESSPQQLMQNMTESSPEQLMQSLSETSPQQLMQSMDTSSQQLMQSLSESSPQQLMQNMTESSPEQLMQSLSESSPQQLMQSMDTSSRQLMQSLSESSPQQLMQNMTESSPQQLMQSLSETSPQQLMQSMDTSPQQLMQSMDTSSQQLMQNMTESSPQQLMQNMTESSPQQLMQSLSESSPQQLIQSVSDSSPLQLMQSMDSSPQQLIQSVSDSSPQQLMQSMDSSPQQLMQSMDSSPQQLMQSMDSSPQQLMRNMGDTYAQPSNSLLSDHCSEASLSPSHLASSGAQRPYPQAMDDSNSPPAAARPPGETSECLLIDMMRKSDDLKMQSLAEQHSGGGQDMLLLSQDPSRANALLLPQDPSRANALLLSRDPSGSSSQQDASRLSPDQSGGNSLLLARGRLLSDAAADAKLLTFMTPLADKPDDLQRFAPRLPAVASEPALFSEAAPGTSSGGQLLSLAASSAPSQQQMLDVIVSTVPAQPSERPPEAPKGVFAPSAAAESLPSAPAAARQILQLLVKAEEPKDIPSEITQMSATDLLSFINPDCFNNV